MEAICENCWFWEVSELLVLKDWGECTCPKVIAFVDVGHSDDWNFNKNFGCKFYANREVVNNAK